MARYLKRSKTVLLHIPHTGGTWREEMIDFSRIRSQDWVKRSKHALLCHYNTNRLSKVLRVATFVREPHALYESIWRCMHNTNVKSRRWLIKRSAHPDSVSAKHYVPDFSLWLEAMLKHEPAYVTRIYESFIGPFGGEFCWYVGRMETLNNDFCDLMRRLGYKRNMDRFEGEVKKQDPIHVSSGDRFDWPDDLWKRVSEMERLVIDNFYGENENKRIYAGIWTTQNQHMMEDHLNVEP